MNTRQLRALKDFTSLVGKKRATVVFTRLVRQGKRSHDGQACKYRRDHTPHCRTRCLVGHMITAKNYGPNMEELLGSSPTIVKACGLQYSNKTASILRDAQSFLHDTIWEGEKEFWQECLEKIPSL